MPEHPPSSKRSGSQKRRRSRHIDVCCDEDEFVAIDHNACAAGLSRAGYLRATGIGSPGPRAQRAPHPNADVLARLTAELNKTGGNLNQLTRRFNSGAPVAAKETDAILALVRQAVTNILHSLRHKEPS
jgi:hypothetical protein